MTIATSCCSYVPLLLALASCLLSSAALAVALLLYSNIAAENQILVEQEHLCMHCTSFMGSSKKSFNVSWVDNPKLR